MVHLAWPLCTKVCKGRSLDASVDPTRAGHEAMGALRCARSSGWRCAKRLQSSAALKFPPLSDETSRAQPTPTDRGQQMSRVHVPRPAAQRAPARVHELTGSPLRGRLAGDRSPLDGRRPHRLLPDARRPATLLAGPSSTSSSPRCSAPAGRGHGRRRASRRTGRLSASTGRHWAARRSRPAPAQLARRPNFSRSRR